MAFPTDFPEVALQTLAGYVTGSPPSLPLTALAAYDIAGYGMYFYFGDVKYPMTALPDATALAQKILSLLPARANLPDKATVIKAVADAVIKAQAGGTFITILTTLIQELGPTLLPLLLQLLPLILQLANGS